MHSLKLIFGILLIMSLIISCGLKREESDFNNPLDVSEDAGEDKKKELTETYKVKAVAELNKVTVTWQLNGGFEFDYINIYRRHAQNSSKPLLLERVESTISFFTEETLKSKLLDGNKFIYSIGLGVSDQEETSTLIDSNQVEIKVDRDNDGVRDSTEDTKGCNADVAKERCTSKR